MCRGMNLAQGYMCHMRRRIHVSYEEEEDTCVEV